MAVIVTLRLEECLVTGLLSDETTNSHKVFQNTVQNTVTIEVSGTEMGVNFALTDLLGRILKKGEINSKFTLTLNDPPSSIYVVIIELNNQRIAKQLTKI